MSTSTLQVNGPNKAFVRTAARAGALAGSAIIWGLLGYLALTYVPKFEKPPEEVETTIDGVRFPIVIPPPPPPVVEPLKQDRPLLRTQDPTASTPRLTIRQPITDRPNPLPSDLSAGDVSNSPVTFVEPGPITGGREWEEPIVLATPPEAVVVPDPPAPTPVVQMVINPVRIAGSNPVFPNRALDRGISGQVTLSFTVSPNGKVENINVTGEDPSGYGFARAARDAVQNWTFQPQTIDGVPVAYPARYTISFKLED
jgi:periplasmic protein TonB